MNYQRIGEHQDMVWLRAGDVKVVDEQSMLELLMEVQYVTNSMQVVLDQACLPATFFQLSNQLAGSILQKVVSYGFQLAIICDVSQFNSKALNDFIRESNRGRHIYFVSDIEHAITMLEQK
ncbi:MAG: DUF4180 domain-containing protein [Erysipelotrichaceae bacterium]